MRLGIISDCKHYRMPNGEIGTENHILLRQLEALSIYFESTVICCPFLDYNNNLVLTAYRSTAITFLPVRWGAGETIKERIKIINRLPEWWKAFKTIDKNTDIVYLRLPNAFNFVGFFYFWLHRKNVFATYTGTWHDHQHESITYTFQRWLLRKAFRGPVWVYSASNDGHQRLHPNYSPSYSHHEWEQEESNIKERISRLRTEGLNHFRFITVGALTDYKNQIGILKACKILKDKGLSFSLTIVGGGPKRKEIEQFIAKSNLHTEVTVAGKKTAEDLRVLYRNHDFVVQAPKYEGFGKVPIEGMFHGAIPAINNISMASYMTGGEERGFLFNASRPENIAEALFSIKDKIDKLPDMIVKGREFTKRQTLESWAKEYYETVANYYKEA